MAPWIPKKSEKFLNPLFKKISKRNKIKICGAYWGITKKLYLLRRYIVYGRKYNAPINPFELYWISPDEITWYHNKRIGDRHGPLLKAGDWDLSLTPFDAKPTYQSFIDRFVHGEAWKKTYEYKKLKRKGMVERLEYYDKLYEDMKLNGYKLQNDIHSIEERLESPGKFQYMIPEYNEIIVDVARDGELIWYDGQHRLSLAKILNIDEIPIRIRLRHTEWQKNRERAINNPNEIPDEIRDHIDIRTIIK